MGYKAGWTDAGCDDFAKAKANRERVARNYGGAVYDQVQRSLEAIPVTAPLPKSIPVGELPELILPKEEKNDFEDA